MLSIILIAWILVAITVGVHAAGLVVVLKAFRRWSVYQLTGFWPITRRLILIAWCLIVLHLVEIFVWGLFYLWWECLPTAEAAFYFSGVTYATIGYGDVVLAQPWRALAPIEGLTGILMCGLSTGLIFAVVNSVYHSLQVKTPSDEVKG